jgi:hypothetical protein
MGREFLRLFGQLFHLAMSAQRHRAVGRTQMSKDIQRAASD